MRGPRRTSRRRRRPGSALPITLDALAGRPYDLLARLRAVEPSPGSRRSTAGWSPGATCASRSCATRPASPSTTHVLDGAGRRAEHAVARRPEHRRHRDPFATAFHKPEERRFTAASQDAARSWSPRSHPGRRRDPPRPGGSAGGRGRCGGARPARRRAGDGPRLVRRDRRRGRPSLGRWRDRPRARGRRAHARGACVEHDRARQWRLAEATATLSPAEVASNAAVMMFGGIETGEGMTTNLFWHLLTDPDQLAALRADRTSAPNAVEESLRLEPAAARVDRYATWTSSWAGRGSRAATSSSSR